MDAEFASTRPLIVEVVVVVAAAVMAVAAAVAMAAAAVIMAAVVVVMVSNIVLSISSQILMFIQEDNKEEEVTDTKLEKGPKSGCAAILTW